MIKKCVLIIDKRIELSTKYRKLLEQLKIYTFVAHELNDAIKYLTQYEPDLIIVSDSLDGRLSENCQKIKMLASNTRPSIVAISKSEHLQDKLDVLDMGADDFLSEPIESEEFKARINAHLRRNFENNINEKTNLPSSKIAFQVFRRTINEKELFSALLIDIKYSFEYREIYGNLAYDKMMQTLTAIINSAIDENDFVGQFSADDFLVITHPMKAEKICQYLIAAFDSIKRKFYSDEDSQRGYILTSGEDKEGVAIPLVALSIGGISNEYKQYSTAGQAINSMILLHDLAKSEDKSKYIMERPKLNGENSIENELYNNNILIIEPDEALSTLLSSTLELQGYEVTTTNTYEDFDEINFENYALVVIEAGDKKDYKGLEICKKIKEEIPKVKVIVSNIYHDKEAVLNAKADLYLPKPFELSVLFGFIQDLIRDYNY